MYAAAVAVANVIRQLIMPGDVSTEAQVVTLAGLIVGVSAIVTLAHIGLTGAGAHACGPVPSPELPRRGTGATRLRVEMSTPEPAGDRGMREPKSQPRRTA